ncbi:MAG: M14 family zinc carboxypeptidase [Pseudomonadota bacterium]
MIYNNYINERMRSGARHVARRGVAVLTMAAVCLSAAPPAKAVSSLYGFDPFSMPVFQAVPDDAPDETVDAPVEAAIDVIPQADPALAETDGDGVEDVDPIATLCSEIDTKLTSVNFEECMALGLYPSGAVSNKKKVIAMRDYAPSDASPRGRVLFIGGIHGDEYSSVTAVFRWQQRLAKDQGGGFHWRVVPLLNPDGLLMPPDQSTRMNANGVDLNRNFPTPNWTEEATKYWIETARRNKRRYPGPGPLSEPESRWIAEQIDTYKPDAVISVHAPHGIVDFDGPRIPPENLGPLELRLLGTYPGSMGRYVGVYKGIPILTLELESAGRLPEDKDMDGIWFDMVDWLAAKVGGEGEGLARRGNNDEPPQVTEAATP